MSECTVVNTPKEGQFSSKMTRFSLGLVHWLPPSLAVVWFVCHMHGIPNTLGLRTRTHCGWSENVSGLWAAIENYVNLCGANECSLRTHWWHSHCRGGFLAVVQTVFTQCRGHHTQDVRSRAFTRYCFPSQSFDLILSSWNRCSDLRRDRAAIHSRVTVGIFRSQTGVPNQEWRQQCRQWWRRGDRDRPL